MVQFPNIFSSLTLPPINTQDHFLKMMNWKLTKKLKDFSRSKSPAPEKEEVTPDSSTQTNIVPDNNGEGSSHRDSATKDSSDDGSRRKTIVPSDEPTSTNELTAGSSIKPSSSRSSNRTLNSANRQDTPDTTLSSTFGQTKNFSPGILTLKIYNGSHFKVPFDLNFDKSIISKLINSSSSSNIHEEELIRQLNGLTIQHDEKNLNKVTDSGVDEGSFIPASITIPSSNNIKSSLIYFTLEFDKTIVSVDAESGTVANPIFNKISQFDVTKPINELKFQVFLKLPSILTTGDGDKNAPSQDTLIGSKTIDVKCDGISNPIRLKNHDAVKFDNEHPDFNDSTNGELIISIDFKPNQNKHLSIDDFDLLKVIGKGSFGKVMQVRKKDSQKIYALKAIRKSHIVSKNEVIHTLAERTVLANVNNPFIVPLKFSFQSPEKLYLVLNFINGGELFHHLQEAGRFELSRARFYTCELLSALDCLHSMDVIYRDLKPENILLDYKGHIALCDFGLCKLNMKNDDQTRTFCGTPEYLAPELLLGTGYTKAVDWWTLGVLLYEMLTGLPPYYDEDVNKMYQRILRDPLRFPDNFDRDAKDLLIKLLSRDPALRLGVNGAREIQQHDFFKKIDWNKLNNKQYLPPFRPTVRDGFDTSNFDQEFTKELPVDSVVNEYLSDSVQRQFGGWTYVGTEHLNESRV